MEVSPAVRVGRRRMSSVIWLAAVESRTERDV